MRLYNRFGHFTPLGHRVNKKIHEIFDSEITKLVKQGIDASDLDRMVSMCVTMEVIFAVTREKFAEQRKNLDNRKKK